MSKIDRLGWVAGISFQSYGLRIGIRVNAPELLHRLPPLLPPGWKPSASPTVDHLYSLRAGGEGSRSGLRRLHLVFAGAARLARTTDLEAALSALAWHLDLSVATSTPRRVFVHAGVVGWHGRAILVPGHSLSGKSSLVAALVRAGASYYSDEYAVLDARGRAHPFPRPLSLRETPGEPGRKCPVEALGGRAGLKPLPVGLVVVTEYQPGARWRPRRLSPGRALLAIMDNTVPARIRPDLTLATLQQVVSQATVLKGRRGEAEETVGPLLRLLSG